MGIRFETGEREELKATYQEFKAVWAAEIAKSGITKYSAVVSLPRMAPILHARMLKSFEKVGVMFRAGFRIAGVYPPAFLGDYRCVSLSQFGVCRAGPRTLGYTAGLLVAAGVWREDEVLASIGAGNGV